MKYSYKDRLLALLVWFFIILACSLVESYPFNSQKNYTNLTNYEKPIWFEAIDMTIPKHKISRKFLTCRYCERK